MTFKDKTFEEAVRKAAPYGVLTEETLAEITTLELEWMPEDLSLLEQLPNLEKIRLPQSQAVYALAAVGEKYTIVLAPEEVTAQ